MCCKWTWQALFADRFAGCDRLQVCANLPYYITTPVLMRLLESELPIERLVVMVQLEAAKRLCAPLGTRGLRRCVRSGGILYAGGDLV